MAVAWVTGASSGLGYYTALALKQAGWQVAGGARSFSDEEKEGIHCLKLDVSDQRSVDSFCEAALARFGQPDALVNAAGVLNIGACEDYSEEELRAVMEVNFFGMTRMVKAVLPHMREKGKGRIVNFSSINGLMAIPFQGAYAASKHAIEGYSEALWMELSPLGIEVMLVEPGDHRGGSAKYRSRSARCSPCYADNRERAIERIEADEAAGAFPKTLGNKVAKVMSLRKMPPRLRVAQTVQHIAAMLHDILPNRLFFRLLNLYYGIKPNNTND